MSPVHHPSQVMEDSRPWLDMAHVVACLNRLDAGVPDKICLMSRDEQNVLVVSYGELKVRTVNSEVRQVSNNLLLASIYDILHMKTTGSGWTGSRRKGQTQSSTGAQP